MRLARLLGVIATLATALVTTLALTAPGASAATPTTQLNVSIPGINIKCSQAVDVGGGLHAVACVGGSTAAGQILVDAGVVSAGRSIQPVHIDVGLRAPGRDTTALGSCSSNVRPGQQAICLFSAPARYPVYGWAVVRSASGKSYRLVTPSVTG